MRQPAMGTAGIDLVRTIWYDDPMRRTNIHLTDEQREWLRDYAARNKSLPAAVVRLAIDHYREATERRTDRRGPRPSTRERRKAAER
jgi:hypothetical protein